MLTQRQPTHPGEILREDVIKPLALQRNIMTTSFLCQCETNKNGDYVAVSILSIQ